MTLRPYLPPESHILLGSLSYPRLQVDVKLQKWDNIEFGDRLECLFVWTFILLRFLLELAATCDHSALLLTLVLAAAFASFWLEGRLICLSFLRLETDLLGVGRLGRVVLLAHHCASFVRAHHRAWGRMGFGLLFNCRRDYRAFLFVGRRG